MTKSAAPVRHSVTESIRNSIALGYFTAGQRITERDLCEMTGVSRTAVREALRQLESEGLVTVVPHRGPIVTRLTPEQAEGIYQVRVELEGLACELFAKNATDDDIVALKAAFEVLKGIEKITDPLERLTAKNNFYECLIFGAHNEALGHTLSSLNARVMVLRATSLAAPGRTHESLLELDELVTLLSERRGKEARKVAGRHVMNAGKVAIAILRERLAEESAAAAQ
ncbi:GntR family transcriptional regulator [Neotabrizicola sp. VNH66]|uniref:GntR family transcriptional regulator n=1 Tax=Neotabrizicola sp. VNH66 TaxID=3400918 RepID=UPI003C2C382C